MDYNHERRKDFFEGGQQWIFPGVAKTISLVGDNSGDFTFSKLRKQPFLLKLNTKM